MNICHLYDRYVNLRGLIKWMYIIYPTLSSGINT